MTKRQCDKVFEQIKTKQNKTKPKDKIEQLLEITHKVKTFKQFMSSKSLQISHQNNKFVNEISQQKKQKKRQSDKATKRQSENTK